MTEQDFEWRRLEHVRITDEVNRNAWKMYRGKSTHSGLARWLEKAKKWWLRRDDGREGCAS